MKQTSNSINPDKSSPGYRGNRRPGTLGLRYHSESGKPHIMKPDSLDLDGPKRRRGRPKSVSAADSDKGNFFSANRNKICLVFSSAEMLKKGMFKNNEAFHFMASNAHVCLNFKDQT